MQNSKVDRDVIFLMYATHECMRAIQAFEKMLRMLDVRTEKTSRTLELEDGGRTLEFGADGKVHRVENESVFEALRLGLHFSANASRVFWPDPRKPKAAQRGKALCALAGLVDDHPLSKRLLRNRVEHMDENMDDWTKDSPRPFLGFEMILPAHAPPQMREQIREGTCMVFDAAAREVTAFGKTFPLGDMISDLRDLQGKIGQTIKSKLKIP